MKCKAVSVHQYYVALSSLLNCRSDTVSAQPNLPCNVSRATASIWILFGSAHSSTAATISRVFRQSTTISAMRSSKAAACMVAHSSRVN
ncbi:hypothetical protein AHF37_00717 [Paragonimus kellicotti]|nr:hypothetical protein AHF37_00717 [Paragonimus kellicotti]